MHCHGRITPRGAATRLGVICPRFIPTPRKTTQQNDYLTRERILKLLSDDEVAAVSTAKTADHFAASDEFIDLNKFDLGVQRGPRNKTPMGHVLPKKSVHAGTWEKNIAQLPVKIAR